MGSGQLTVADEGSLIISVAHGGKSDVAQTVEHDDDREPNLPGVNVVFVEVPIEPADGEVVDRRQNPGSANSVIGADI